MRLRGSTGCCLRTSGLILGTGPSLSDIAHLIPKFDGLIFGPNNTYKDFPLDVWLACDPAWHALYGRVMGDFDKWHWDKGICEKYGYRYVEGIWHDGLWLDDKSRISLNHCSGAQLLNLACHYDCDPILLVGHDFRYEEGKPRHYFSGLSDVDGEYPEPLRKTSLFIKNNGTYDLLAVYKKIADTPDLPTIINCTPDTALPWFPLGDLEDYV